VKEIIGKIQEICGTNLEIISGNEVRPNEINNVVADISSARENLSWNPEFNIESGLKKTVTSILNSK
jgi:nucleoside-diphosphate-sugar epimerase